MRSEDIATREWTDGEREALRRIAVQQAKGEASRADLDDIPRLTSKQLAGMVRLRDARRKGAVRMRLDT